MVKKLTDELIEIFEEISQYHRKKFDFFLFGESAILIYLLRKKNEKRTPSDLSESLNITSARVAASLNNLETKGFITREIDTEDRRKINIYLTDSGLEEALKTSKIQNDKITFLFNELGQNDSKELIRLLIRVKQIFSEKSEQLC